MAIIKTYDISSVEKVKTIRQNVLTKQQEQEHTKYNASNIMLVRTTDVFPDNRVVSTLANNVVLSENRTNFLCLAMQYVYDDDILNQLQMTNPYYRSTIHFTQNGLVSSHAYGNFDNRSFIILEPLEEQLDKANFRNFAGHDTFIQGNVTLSNRAIIVVKKEQYDLIKNAHPEIDSYNIVLYDGISLEEKEKYIEEHSNELPEFDVNDERAVVEALLMDLGFVPELVGSHYITESKTSSKVREVNSALANIYGVECEAKHHNTKEYSMDFEKRGIIETVFDQLLLNFIIQKRNIDLSSYELNKKIGKDYAYILEGLIGIDSLIEDVNDFNITVREMKNQGLMPTAENIINGVLPNIYNSYIELDIASKRR